MSEAHYAKRGVRLALSGACVQKKSKKCGALKSKLGEVIFEPVASLPSTHDEAGVSRLDGNTPALWSLTQAPTRYSPGLALGECMQKSCWPQRFQRPGLALFELEAQMVHVFLQIFSPP